MIQQNTVDPVTFHLKFPWADAVKAVSVRWNLKSTWGGFTVPQARSTVLIPHIWDDPDFQQTFPWVKDVLKGWNCVPQQRTQHQ